MDINYIAPINSLGYGVAGLNILKSLNKNNKVSYFPIGEPSLQNRQDYELVSETISNAKKPNFKAPCVRIWHQHDMSQFVGKGIHAGFPIFELDTFTEQEIHHLKSLDTILVCSQWAKDIILNNLEHDSVVVSPLGVDRSVFQQTEVTDGSTKFFNCGKWEIRKGHDILFEAFNSAFNEDDDVELWMMCHNPFYSEEENREWENLYLSSKLGSKIKIIPRQETHLDVFNIMSGVDCGVFPARAEGWNLELLEMMSCGKSVIATDYSAHTEFCSGDNCGLIPINETELAYDGKWFSGQGSWAKIDESAKKSIANEMRKVHELKKTGSLKVNSKGVQRASELSWDNTSEKILGALQ